MLSDRISRPLVCLFGMLVFVAGCRGVPDGTPDQLLRRGNQLMAKKRYKHARRHYDALVKRYPVREAVHTKADGRTLVHVGIREERRPEATLGTLLLLR